LFLLTLLRERPLHGVDMMRSIEEMSAGGWKPSPGSVYPLLRRMERDGLIRGKWQRTRGAPKRVYQLTSKGRSSIPKMQRDMLSELYAAQNIVDTHIVALEAAIGGGEDGAG
jgi:DNA-binding PadR family transcriptional regulator